MILRHYVSYIGLKDSLLFSLTDILFFYMPWFFFKAGMFFSPVEHNQRLSVIKKDVNRLIIPYIFFSFVGIIVNIIFATYTNEMTPLQVCINGGGGFLQSGYLDWSSHLWFLLSLFFVRLVYRKIYNVNWVLIIGVALGIAVIHNVYIAPYGIVWIGNFCSGLVFYVLGSKLKMIQYNKSVFVLSVIVLILMAHICPTIVSMMKNEVINRGIYIFWFPFCLSGIIVFNNIFKYSLRFFDSTFLISIGKDSMSYYLLHFTIPILFCRLYRYNNPEGNKWEFLCYMLISVSILLPILCKVFKNKYLSWIVGVNKK